MQLEKNHSFGILTCGPDTGIRLSPTLRQASGCCSIPPMPYGRGIGCVSICCVSGFLRRLRVSAIPWFSSMRAEKIVVHTCEACSRVNVPPGRVYVTPPCSRDELR